MALIESQLEGLLLSHDCVIIPGLGGFVCNQRPARYDEERQELFPPTRAFQFNERLVHHDGLLAGALCSLGGHDYEGAVAAIHGEVEAMQAALATGVHVNLGGVGRLYRGDNDKLQFSADRRMVRMLSAYALEGIPLRPIGVAKPNEGPTPVPEPIVRTMRPRHTLRRVAAIVGLPLVVGAGYWAAAPHVEGMERMNVAGWIVPAPVEANYLPRFAEEDVRLSVSRTAETFASFADAAGDASWLKFDFESGMPSANGTTVLLNVDPPVKTVARPEAAEKFLIVVGAFGVEQNAHSLAKELIEAGYIASIRLQPNGLHIVASGAFEGEKEAREHLYDVRAEGRKAAWLKRLS